MRSFEPGAAKWSPAAAPLACCCAMISSNAVLARSTTVVSGKAPRITTIPGPSANACTSSSGGASRMPAAV